MKTKDLLKERGSHTKKRQVPVTQVFPAAFGGQGIFLSLPAYSYFETDSFSKPIPWSVTVTLLLIPALLLIPCTTAYSLLCCLFPALLPLPYSAAAALRRFIISSTSAFSITRGGTKRIILVPALINTSFCSSSAFDTMGPAGTENSNP